MNSQQIIKKLYETYGTDSGILFGITERPIVEAIVNFTLQHSNKAEEDRINKRKFNSTFFDVDENGEPL